MVSLGFLNASNAPMEEAKMALPTHLHSPEPDVVEKTIVLFMTKPHFRQTKISQLSGQLRAQV